MADGRKHVCPLPSLPLLFAVRHPCVHCANHELAVSPRHGLPSSEHPDIG